jgi:hypothetical protein
MYISNKHLKEMLEIKLEREVAVKEFKKMRKYNSVETKKIPNAEDIKTRVRIGNVSARLYVEWFGGTKVCFKSDLNNSELVILNNPSNLNLSKLDGLLGSNIEFFDVKIKRIKKYLEDKHDINLLI